LKNYLDSPAAKTGEAINSGIAASASAQTVKRNKFLFPFITTRGVMFVSSSIPLHSVLQKLFVSVTD
jgi:hypothetical protein